MKCSVYFLFLLLDGISLLISIKHSKLASDKAVHILASHALSSAAHTCLCSKHGVNQKLLGGFFDAQIMA